MSIWSPDLRSSVWTIGNTAMPSEDTHGRTKIQMWDMSEYFLTGIKEFRGIHLNLKIERHRVLSFPLSEKKRRIMKIWKLLYLTILDYRENTSLNFYQIDLWLLQKPLLKMHFKTHFGDLLTAEQEKILLETSELFNENILNLRLVGTRFLSHTLRVIF